MRDVDEIGRNREGRLHHQVRMEHPETAAVLGGALHRAREMLGDHRRSSACSPTEREAADDQQERHRNRRAALSRVTVYHAGRFPGDRTAPPARTLSRRARACHRRWRSAPRLSTPAHRRSRPPGGTARPAPPCRPRVRRSIEMRLARSAPAALTRRGSSPAYIARDEVSGIAARRGGEQPAGSGLRAGGDAPIMPRTSLLRVGRPDRHARG